MLIDVKTLDDNFCAKCTDFEVEQNKSVRYSNNSTNPCTIDTSYRCRWLDRRLQRDKFLKERNNND